MSKNPIDDNSVQATMVMPLWGRANCSKKYPEVLEDPKSIEIFEKMVADFDFDVSKIEQFHRDRAEYYGLVFCTRARNFDNALNDYIKVKPHATVANLGAGMDTGYYRNDNGILQWIDIDFRNVIELRNTYLPGHTVHRQSIRHGIRLCRQRCGCRVAGRRRLRQACSCFHRCRYRLRCLRCS